jgi:3-isopropylmalate/(R)-2-methylmalate dehydratase small subunit
VSLEEFTLRNRDSGAVLKSPPIPLMLLDLMRGGGLYPHLEREGLLEATGSKIG